MKYNPWLPDLRENSEFFEQFIGISNRFLAGALKGNELAEWKQSQLSGILDYVKTRSPFYARQLAPYDLTSVTVETLSTLPYTTKDDLRAAQDDILSGDVRDAQFYYQTSGTTGAPSPCPRSVMECLTSNYFIEQNLIEIVKDIESSSGKKPIVGVLAPNEVHSMCDTMADICKNLGVMNVDLWPVSPALGYPRCIDVLRRLQLEVTITSPAIMLSLAREAIKLGLSPTRDFNIKYILTTGDMCTRAMANNLAAVWGCRVFSFIYGSQEAHGIASSCGEKLVPAIPSYIFEVIDQKTDVPLGESGTGELCLTMLTKGIKPLIRYRTGDVVKLTINPESPSPAECSIEILGRCKDAFQIGKRWITPAELEEMLLQGFTHCAGYQLVLQDGAGNDKLLVKLEFLGEFQPSSPSIASLADRLESFLSMQVSVEVVQALDRITGTSAWFTWKAARLVDERPLISEEQFAHQAVIKAARNFIEGRS
jgi:phenylacetate-CoA ligase